MEKINLTVLRKRLIILMILFSLVFVIYISRLWYLQITRYEYYSRKARENILRILDIPAPRGLILDRKGKIVVDNVYSFSLMLTREYVRNWKDAESVITSYFGIEKRYLEKKLKKYRGVPDSIPILLKKNLSFGEMAFLEAHRFKYPFLSLEEVPSRRYIFGDLFCHVIGYTGEINLKEIKSPKFKGFKVGDIIGKYGIEREYNNVLTGKKGKKIVLVNSIGKITKILKIIPPKRGKTLNLSIDIKLQKAAYEAMGDRVGSVVAIDVNSGGVLCMVSKPTFDPNALVSNIKIKDWQRLITDPDKPFQNRSISGLYSPGSVFKILMALIGLETGKITPDTSFFCSGVTEIGGRIAHCWKKGGHGWVKLKDAIINSCNIYFYNVGIRVGIDNIFKYGTLVGFGKKTGIDLQNEKSGLLPSREWKWKNFHTKWYQGETVSVAIGQGQVLVTPLQLALFMAKIAVNDSSISPFVSYLSERKRKNVKIFDDDKLQIVKNAMVEVVERGTATRARIKGIKIAGKTGTAQIIDTKTAEKLKNYKKKYKENSIFACFAPADNPQIAVAVVVEHGGHGGSTAAPIARDVLLEFFREEGLIK